ncbi:MAG: ATP-grasp domain-containing protein [Phycisphaeraceae bacterium]|nr:ATP-grasp domain-containing protein [Phycisphaeraceae bacterium]
MATGEGLASYAWVMHIGLTYDLKDEYLAQGYTPDECSELDCVETVDALAAVAESMGHRTTRVGHVKELARRLVAGERWDLVINIAEGMHGIGREAQVPALLDAYRIPYTFSDPLVCALTLHKGMCKRVVRDMGLNTARFGLVGCERDLGSIELVYPLFAKPVAEGSSKGVTGASKISTPRELRDVCLGLLERYGQPVLVEEYLPGREFTVGIVGTGERARVLGCMEIHIGPDAPHGFYSATNKDDWVGKVSYSIATDDEARAAADLALASYRGLGCRDVSRVDVRTDRNGKPAFIEINPLPGLRPGWSDLVFLCTYAGIEYEQLVRWIIESAMERVCEGSRVGHAAGARG